MTGETDSAGGGEGTPAGPPGSVPRPWTPEAAMEPVVPLAPPPARPGPTRVPPGANATPPARSGTAARIILLALLVGALIAVLVITGR